MTKQLKLAGQVAALAAVATLLGLLVWKLTHQTHAPKIGGPAPNFTASRVDASGKLDLASLRGKPVVLNFWASWCVPCKGEAKLLEQAWRQYKGKGVVFVGVLGGAAVLAVGVWRWSRMREPDDDDLHVDAEMDARIDDLLARMD